ncbi:MAG TPA: monovalent cation/H+ antiporter complex subunit F [Myxococcales bacterium]|jgi:multisubunit Na+/H+ antiporter MnhF subunit|nr:monovalent cation/H+ antiporter complex subunit F [Myxococcales bacterium]
MSAWLAGALALCAGLAPCAAVALRAQDVMERVVALEMASVLVTLALVMLAEAMQRTLFLDLALTQALLSFGGGLVFARFLERWV